MPVRPIEPLKREQQAMIDELRRLTSEAAFPASEPDDAGSAEVYRLARVTQVVSSDSELGPHLKLTLQKWVGRPPASSDGPLPAKTAYPTPNHPVSAYGVDEIVAVWSLGGTLVAAKLA